MRLWPPSREAGGALPPLTSVECPGHSEAGVRGARGSTPVTIRRAHVLGRVEPRPAANNSKRTIAASPGRAVNWGTGIVILLYALTNFTYHSTLGIEGMRGSTVVASDVMMVLIGPVGATLITILVIISATGSMNGRGLG